MQLKKHHWKGVRTTPKFTQPIEFTGVYRSRHGRTLTHEQKSEQLDSRLKNPQDPINRN